MNSVYHISSLDQKVLNTVLSRVKENNSTYEAEKSNILNDIQNRGMRQRAEQCFDRIDQYLTKRKQANDSTNSKHIGRNS